MDKKVFLLDKDHYTKEMVENLTEKDLEEWVAEEDYEENYSILKIDANDYNSVEDAINKEGWDYLKDDCYVVSFGF